MWSHSSHQVPTLPKMFTVNPDGTACHEKLSAELIALLYDDLTH